MYQQICIWNNQIIAYLEIQKNQQELNRGQNQFSTTNIYRMEKRLDGEMAINHLVPVLHNKIYLNVGQ